MSTRARYRPWFREPPSPGVEPWWREAILAAMPEPELPIERREIWVTASYVMVPIEPPCDLCGWPISSHQFYRINGMDAVWHPAPRARPGA